MPTVEVSKYLIGVISDGAEYYKKVNKHLCDKYVNCIRVICINQNIHNLAETSKKKLPETQILLGFLIF